jgi:hypothetical protein
MWLRQLLIPPIFIGPAVLYGCFDVVEGGKGGLGDRAIGEDVALSNRLKRKSNSAHVDIGNQLRKEIADFFEQCRHE